MRRRGRSTLRELQMGQCRMYRAGESQAKVSLPQPKKNPVSLAQPPIPSILICALALISLLGHACIFRPVRASFWLGASAAERLTDSLCSGTDGRPSDVCFSQFGTAMFRPMTQVAHFRPCSCLVPTDTTPKMILRWREKKSELTHSGVKEEHPPTPSCQRRRSQDPAVCRDAIRCAGRPRQFGIQYHHRCDITHRRCVGRIAEPRFRKPWGRQSVHERRIG